jgi:hypothetical protein
MYKNSAGDTQHGLRLHASLPTYYWCLVYNEPSCVAVTAIVMAWHDQCGEFGVCVFRRKALKATRPCRDKARLAKRDAPVCIFALSGWLQPRLGMPDGGGRCQCLAVCGGHFSLADERHNCDRPHQGVEY